MDNQNSRFVINSPCDARDMSDKNAVSISVEESDCKLILTIQKLGSSEKEALGWIIIENTGELLNLEVKRITRSGNDFKLVADIDIADVDKFF